MTAKWRFTRHAQQRMGEMGVDIAEALRVLENPETVYPAPRKYPGCQIATGGRLAVPFDPATSHIITVLWNTAPMGGEEFSRDQESPYGELEPDPEPEPEPKPDPGPKKIIGLDPLDRQTLRRVGRRMSYADLAYIESDEPLCLDCGRDHRGVLDALACDQALHAAAAG